MYMHVYLYVYVSVYVCVYMYRHICIWICLNEDVTVYARIHVYFYAHMDFIFICIGMCLRLKKFFEDENGGRCAGDFISQRSGGLNTTSR